jgi:haloacetate dehalogenase
MLFEGFQPHALTTPRGTVHAVVGGDGPPLLLVHGFPQTHLMWHAVAPALAEHFTVIVPDLPGYGQSFRPPVSADHDAHSKRALAADLVAAMAALGYERFALCGHDRGARVSYRMALDHPEQVTRLMVLDVVPTGEIWKRADATFALVYWHWGFLAQPAPLPEQMILANADAFWIAAERLGLKPDDPRFPWETLDAYRAQLTDPAAVEAMCEDYRAGATIDRVHDAEGGTIACPVRALWGADGALPRFYPDPLDLWRDFAPAVTGRAIEDAGHFLVEDQPEVALGELREFFAT